MRRFAGTAMVIAFAVGVRTIWSIYPPDHPAPPPAHRISGMLFTLGGLALFLTKPHATDRATAVAACSNPESRQRTSAWVLGAGQLPSGQHRQDLTPCDLALWTEYAAHSAGQQWRPYLELTAAGTLTLRDEASMPWANSTSLTLGERLRKLSYTWQPEQANHGPERIWVAVYLQSGVSAGARSKLIARMRRLGVTDVLFVGSARVSSRVRAQGPSAAEVDCPVGWAHLAEEGAFPSIRDPSRLGVP